MGPAAEAIQLEEGPRRRLKRVPPPARILLVDDDPACLDAVRGILADGRATVCPAPSAAEAIALARLFELDLAIVDYDLGGELTGLALGRILCSIRPALRLLLISGVDLAALGPEIARAGFAGCLAKPFGAEPLWDAVRRVLEPGRLAPPVLASGARD